MEQKLIELKGKLTNLQSRWEISVLSSQQLTEQMSRNQDTDNLNNTLNQPDLNSTQKALYQAAECTSFSSSLRTHPRLTMFCAVT